MTGVGPDRAIVELAQRGEPKYMRILQLAPIIESVPPTAYGGTELVVSLLTEELVARGHEVMLIAAGDSHTSAQLEAIVPRSLRADQSVPINEWPAWDMRALLRMEELAPHFDLVHNNMGYQALPFLQAVNKPVVSTNHNRITDIFRPIYNKYSHLPFVAISHAYRRLNMPHELNYAGTIYNGIDTQLYAGERAANPSYLLFLGRISPDKGTVEAIHVARRLGLPLVIAGKVDIVDRDYFETLVKPLLKEPGIEFIGEADQDKKAELYLSCRALVYPVGFDEPFGLVMAEALASGCPVMAFDRGSIREVLSDGETAVIGDTVDDLVKRFGEIDSISSDACRKRARDHFSKEHMAEMYEQCYKRVITRYLDDAFELGTACGSPLTNVIVS